MAVEPDPVPLKICGILWVQTACLGLMHLMPEGYGKVAGHCPLIGSVTIGYRLPASLSSRRTGLDFAILPGAIHSMAPVLHHTISQCQMVIRKPNPQARYKAIKGVEVMVAVPAAWGYALRAMRIDA